MLRSPKARRCASVGLTLLAALLVAGAAFAGSTLDPGFGNEGIVETPLPPAEAERVRDSGQWPLIEDLARASDGGILAALGSAGETPYFGAARYRTGGALDTSFGNEGFVRLEATYRGLSGDAELEALAPQRDGKIVLAGYRHNRYEHSAPLLVRLGANGKPDHGFGKGGLVAPHPVGKGAEVLHDVAVLPSGRIVAVGARNEQGGGKPAALVIAYRQNGRIDRSFGSSGRVFFASRRGADYYTALRSIGLLPSGKLLVSGYRDNRLLVARLRPNGHLDRSFGDDGEVSIDLGLTGCCPIRAGLALLPGGGAVVFASVPGGGAKLVHLKPNGALQRSFGRRGVVFDRNARRLADPSGLAVQTNDRIVLVGTTPRVRSNGGPPKYVFTTSRYLPDGRPDRGFGKGGMSFQLHGYDSIGASALGLSNGKVLGGGSLVIAKSDFDFRLLLARTRP
jgi:uncharacterized delta-60 repeat protein